MTGATFTIHRTEDPSGVSGTGVVAEGWETSRGQVVIAWLSDTPSICIYADVRDVERVHGHHGKSQIVWDTPTQYTPTATASTSSLWESHDDPEVNK
jgi:hypothetical protein